MCTLENVENYKKELAAPTLTPQAAAEDMPEKRPVTTVLNGKGTVIKIYSILWLHNIEYIYVLKGSCACAVSTYACSWRL